MPLSDKDVAVRQDYANGLTLVQEQVEWYSKRASELKTRAQNSDLIVISAGAAVAAIPTMVTGPFGGLLVSILGVLIAVTQGAQRIFRSSEVWPGYREAAEALRREYRMFSYGGGVYESDFDAACATYLKRTEEIMANEQKRYFHDLKSDA